MNVGKIVLAASAFYSSIALSGDIPVDDLSNFVNVYQYIQNNFAGDIDDSTLIKNAIKGMVAGIDDHSQYYIGEDGDFIGKSINGGFSGIGVEIELSKNGSLVISPISDTPAERAGLLSGDLITMVNEINTTTPDGANQGIRDIGLGGGDYVDLAILRGGEDFVFRIKREPIQVKSIKYGLLEKKYGYIKIKTFQKDTFKDFNDAILSIRKNDIDGLIIDLRGNPGGLVSESVSIADYFLKFGDLIVSTQSKFDTVQSLAKTGSSYDGKIIVVIDRGTASASEILAAALRDNGAAVVLGERSFGKGTIQSVLSYQNGDTLKITTASYTTPRGEDIQGVGILPDVSVENIYFNKKTIKKKKTKGRIGKLEDLDDPYLSEAILLLKSNRYDSYIGND